MCLYWQKLYLCGCVSHWFRDRCPDCLHSSSDDKCENKAEEGKPRKSYFECYSCLVKEDKEEKDKQLNDKIASAKAADEERKKAREQQVRRDAELRAKREKDDDVRRSRDLRVEMERRKREGGAWVETSGGKKGSRRKGHNNHGHGSSPTTPTTPTTPPAKTIGIQGGVGIFGPLAKEPVDRSADTMASSATAKETSNGASTPRAKGATNGTSGSNITTPPKTNVASANGNGTASLKENVVPPSGNATASLKEKVVPTNGTATASVKENVVPTNGNATASSKANDAPANTTVASGQVNGIDPGGRAGRWGPTKSSGGPKKILKPETPAWTIKKV